MNTNFKSRQKPVFWIVAGIVLVLAGLFAGGSLLGIFPWQGGDLYEDPQERFSLKVDPSWEQIETDGTYTQFKVPDPPMNLYMLVLDAGTIEDAFSQAVEIVGFDPGLLNGGNVTTFGDWQAYGQEDSAGLNYGFVGQIVEGNAFVIVVKMEKPGIAPENPAVIRVLSSVKISGKQEAVIDSYAGVEAMVQKQIDSLAGSVSVAVMHKDQIVYTYVYGQANPIESLAANTQTIYRFGSMTKLFTATALMQLVEQGKVDLDAWPGDYIPEFPQRWNVTVRQLLTHAACMPDDELMTDGLIALPGESLPSLKDAFTSYVKDDHDLICEPGKVSNYANIHYLGLARIIEEVSGEPYETYVVDHILNPLEMKSTSFQVVRANERYAKGQFPTDQVEELISRIDEYRGPGYKNIILQKGESFSTFDDFRILPPWGGLFGTPSDVTHFLQMQLDGGRYGDTQILQPATVAAMQTMQSSTDGSPLGIGLSWWIGKDGSGDYYYHNGGGASIETTMRYYPDLDLGVVVMGDVNGSHANKIADGLVSAWTHEK